MPSLEQYLSNILCNLNMHVGFEEYSTLARVILLVLLDSPECCYIPFLTETT